MMRSCLFPLSLRMKVDSLAYFSDLTPQVTKTTLRPAYHALNRSSVMCFLEPSPQFSRILLHENAEAAVPPHPSIDHHNHCVFPELYRWPSWVHCPLQPSCGGNC